MEQEWDRQHTPTEQLPALIKFINWTMDALTETCHTNGIALEPNTLRSLMINENLWRMGSYQFKVEYNHINVEDFTTLCYEVLNGDIKQAAGFYDEASMLLQRLLCSIFELINSRVANPRERIENLSRRVLVAALLQPKVVIRADAGQQRQLLPTQTCDPPAPARHQPDILGLHLLPPGAQVIAQRVGLHRHQKSLSGDR